MTWYPIAFLPPQYENLNGTPYSGAVLKAYEAGTTTVLPMATTFEGTTTASSFALNANGFPEYSGAVIIPHVQENYKLVFYPTQAAADANSGAIWTIDDIQIADDTNTAFVEYFDGDGSTVTFTLSEDLGNDEDVLMVFADRQLSNHVSNGTFDTDTVWTKGSGWTIGAGVATATGAISTDLTQNAVTPIVAGQSYTITFTVTRSAGGVIPKIGGTSGTERTANGTYTETIVAGSTQALTFSGNAFTGTVDTVTVKPTYAAQRQILRPVDEYTLTGNDLVLTFAPPTGTKNIIVFAPSLLLGAANNAAAAAAVSEANAAASAVDAAASAVDAAGASKWKPAVACATTANITLSGEQTIDTVLTSASRVLVKNQTTVAQNGVYVSAAGAWTRATDADSWTELERQAVFVTGGSANISKSFVNTNESGGTLGTTDVTWIELPTYIADGSITLAKLFSTVAAALCPTGSTLPYAGLTEPTGWLFCYGQAVSRTTYASLFAIISTTYGVGDGSTTFNLPDIRGRVVAGQDDMGGSSANRLTGLSGGVDGDTLGGTGGVESHTLAVSEMPAHTHPGSLGRAANSAIGTSNSATSANTGGLGFNQELQIASQGGGSAHNNVQPTIVLNYIIKT